MLMPLSACQRCPYVPYTWFRRCFSKRRYRPVGGLVVGRPAVAGISERTPRRCRANAWLPSES